MNASLLYRYLLVAVAVAAIGCTAESSSPAADGPIENTLMSFEEFEATVYQEPNTGMYIVNGDTALENREQVKAFFERYVRSGALIVDRSGGVDNRWSDTQKLSLTYCVSTGFGSNYNNVVAAMNMATQAWQGVANIKFVYRSDQDASCHAANANVLFDVSPTSGQPYLARAFFPNYSRANRNILIDSSSFGPIGQYTVAGILRHELGHALGFRHEHTRPETGVCFEDSNWRALTPYDSASVMHYPQCRGTNTGDLVLTQRDRDGVAALYGAPVTPPFNLKSDLYFTHSTTGMHYATQLSPDGSLRNWTWGGGHGVGNAGWSVGDLFGTGRAVYYTHSNDGTHYATQLNADGTLQNWTWRGGHGVGDAGWSVGDLFGTGRAVYYTHSNDGTHYATQLNADGSLQNWTWRGGHGVGDAGWSVGDLFGTGRAVYYTHSNDGTHYATQLNADGSLQNWTWRGGHGVGDAGWSVGDLFGTGRAVYYTHSNNGTHYATQLNADGSLRNWTWWGGHGVGDARWSVGDLFGTGRAVYYTHSNNGTHYATQLNADGSLRNWTWWGGHGVGDASWSVGDLFGAGRAVYYTHSNNGTHYATQLNADGSLRNWTWTGGHGVGDSGWTLLKARGR
jgi:hypothetical protein